MVVVAVVAVITVHGACTVLCVYVRPYNESPGPPSQMSTMPPLPPHICGNHFPAMLSAGLVPGWSVVDKTRVDCDHVLPLSADTCAPMISILLHQLHPLGQQSHFCTVFV